MMIFHFFLVGLGGAIGAMARHGTGLVFLRVLGGASSFPYSTLTVNVFGSLLIGLITGILAHVTAWSQEVRLFAVVGILGGFTTFSAFSLDTLLLVERGHMVQAASYVLLSVALSLCAAFFGLFVVRMVAG